jgi:hypothetical protein
MDIARIGCLNAIRTVPTTASGPNSPAPYKMSDPTAPLGFGRAILHANDLVDDGDIEGAMAYLSAFGLRFQDQAPWLKEEVPLQQALLQWRVGKALEAFELLRGIPIDPARRPQYLLNASLQARMLTELGCANEALDVLRSAVLQAHGPADHGDLHVAIRLMGLLPAEGGLPEWFVGFSRGALQEWAIDVTGKDLTDREQLTAVLAEAFDKAGAPRRAEEDACE